MKLFENLHDLDWDKVLNHICENVTSQAGRLKIQQLTPLPPEEAKKQCNLIIKLSELLPNSNERSYNVDSVDEFHSWYHALIRGATMRVNDFLKILNFCHQWESLKFIVTAVEDTAHINFENLINTINQTIDLEGQIKANATAQLYELYQEKLKLTQQIQKVMEQIIKKYEIQDDLQDRYYTLRENRWVLPIKSGKRHNINGIIHAVSQTKQTVFIEPAEVVQLNNRLTSVESAIQDEIERILMNLSQLAKNHENQLAQAYNLMVRFDALIGAAHWRLRTGGSSFDWNPDRLFVKDLGNPIMVYQGMAVVRNFIDLGSKKILILSGPNAGGKTVLLKSLALAIQCARVGLPICATYAELPYIEEIIVDVGDHQNLLGSLSSFQAQMELLKYALKTAGPKTLIVIDEIVANTDPEEAAALGRAFVEALIEKNAWVLVTTHLGLIKDHWSQDQPVLVGSMDFDLENKKPIYRFVAYVPGFSLALEMAKKWGVPDSILKRAWSLLKPETQNKLTTLDEIQNLKNRLLQLEQQYMREIENLKIQKEALEKEQEQIKKEKQKILEQFAKDLEVKAQTILNEIRATQKFQKSLISQRLAKSLPEIVEYKQKADTPSTDTQKLVLEPGMRVFVKSFRKFGIIQSQILEKNQVIVYLDSMRVTVGLDDIDPALTSSLSVTKGFSHRPKSNLNSHEITFDCRSLTVQEALEKLDSVLDSALQNGVSRVKIIHGHGQNILKKNIRQHLSRMNQIKRWVPGDTLDNDGVTWAILDE